MNPIDELLMFLVNFFAPISGRVLPLFEGIFDLFFQIFDIVRNFVGIPF